MKGNELRIGNIVYDDEGSFSKVTGIKPIDEQVVIDIYYSNNRISKGWMLGVDELSPIPLTEELLLKCGFMDRGDSLIGHVFAKSFVYYITKRCDYFAFRINTLNDQSVFIREVKYLHELQNLYFAITCEELEVEL